MMATAMPAARAVRRRAGRRAHHPTATEEAVVRLFDSIPDGARTLFLILYQLAALWAVGLLVVTVLLLRRWRLWLPWDRAFPPVLTNSNTWN